MEVSTTFSRFILHWGEMHTLGHQPRHLQIHALLYSASGDPRRKDSTRRSASPAGTSTPNLKELQKSDIVHIVHIRGDHRDHFENLDRSLVADKNESSHERRRREIEPTVAVPAQSFSTNQALPPEPAPMEQRMEDTLELLETLRDVVEGRDARARRRDADEAAAPRRAELQKLLTKPPSTAARTVSPPGNRTLPIK